MTMIVKPIAQVVRSPLCVYDKRCGHQARIDPPLLNAARSCWQQPVTCQTCGARGVISTRTTEDA